MFTHNFLRQMFLVIIAITIVLSACGQSREFTIATWNMRNLVDPYDNPYSPDERVKPVSTERLDVITSVILAINADVLAVQEVESGVFLQKLAEERFPQMNYKYIVSVDEQTWFQNVAVLSRFPLGPVTSFKEVETPILGTDEKTNLINHRMIQVEVYPAPGYSFLLSVNHFKAGLRDSRNAQWRLGQIDYLRKRLIQLEKCYPEVNIAVVGDFNALPNSDELKRWTKPKVGPAYIDLLNEIAHPVTKLDDNVPIDYILVNRNMAHEYIKGSIKVVKPFSLEIMQLASDHYPVSARFRAKDVVPQK